MSKVKLSLTTATSLVIASMIGTGIFTSLGFQVVDIKSGFSILLLWIIGGIAAFCGAVSYAELGSIFKRSGGEYTLLSNIYHPSLGFLAGWVSATVGFAAPAALASIAFANYFQVFAPDVSPKLVASVVLLLISLVHSVDMRFGTRFQDLSTLLKVLLILFLIIAGFAMDAPQSISVAPVASSLIEIKQPAFAVALVFVAYAYTGWNSSIYIIDDLDKPEKNLSKSLFFGTLIVMVLYVLLNYVFLLSIPIEEMTGKVEVGLLSGAYLFGAVGGKLVAVIICILLLSTVSAYVFLGPRIIQTMGEDYPALTWLGKSNEKGIPQRAFLFSTLLALSFIIFSSFEQILIYTSFLLILITTLTVFGVYITHFRRQVGTYQTWGYPITPAVFLAVGLWTLIYLVVDKPVESAIAGCILVIGISLYFLASKMKS